MKKRIWTKEELTITYYITKYGMSGLNVSFENIAGGIIPNTSTPSLKMQMACFRFILDIEGYKLEHGSKAMKVLYEELKDKTITQIRNQVKEIISKSEYAIENAKVSQNNTKAYKRRDELNKASEKTFSERLKFLNKYRRLRVK